MSDITVSTPVHALLSASDKTTMRASLDVALASARNVKDFGAVGNGVTDDTAAIQTALDLGGVIYIPAGVYIVDDLEVALDNTTICGSGYASVLKRTSSNMTSAKRILNINKGGPKYMSNITVSELHFDGSWEVGDHYTENEAINAENTENLTLENLWIHNAGQDGIDLDGGNKNPIIKNCRIWDCAGNGIHTYGVTDGVIVGNTIKNIGIGWSNLVSGGRPKAIDFVSDPDSTQTTAQNASRTTVVYGNHIEDCIDGIRVWGNSYNFDISGNSVKNITGTGIFLNGEGHTLGNNSIDGCIVNADGPTSGVGIYLAGDDHVLNGGVIKNCESYSIENFNANNVVISGIRALGNDTTHTAIFQSAAHNCTITGCDLESTATSSAPSTLRVVGDNVIVTGNRIKGYSALEVSSLASDFTITGNRLDGSYRDLTLPASVLMSGIFSGNYLVHNTGNKFATNRGESAVQVGNTYVDVSHGLYQAPDVSDINIVMIEDNSPNNHYWIDNITNNKFRLNCNSAITGDALSFAWKASRNQQ
jgi:hypothetical protein